MDYAHNFLNCKQGKIDQEGLVAMADALLKNKSINQWWIPDSVERQVYVNCLKLVFCLLDKVADTLSIRWVSFTSRARRTQQGGKFEKEIMLHRPMIADCSLCIMYPPCIMHRGVVL
jgi:hypothetical protein